MTTKLTLHTAEEEVAGLPDWLDYAPADENNPHPSIRVFVDSMDYPAPVHTVLRGPAAADLEYYPKDRIKKGEYRYIEPRRDIPFSDVYLVKLYGSAPVFARLTPWLHGNVKVQFANPAYEDIRVLSHMRDKLEVFARVLGEQYAGHNPRLERHAMGYRRKAG